MALFSDDIKLWFWGACIYAFLVFFMPWHNGYEVRRVLLNIESTSYTPNHYLDSFFIIVLVIVFQILTWFLLKLDKRIHQKNQLHPIVNYDLFRIVFLHLIIFVLQVTIVTLSYNGIDYPKTDTICFYFFIIPALITAIGRTFISDKIRFWFYGLFLHLILTLVFSRLGGYGFGIYHTSYRWFIVKNLLIFNFIGEAIPLLLVNIYKKYFTAKNVNSKENSSDNKEL